MSTRVELKFFPEGFAACLDNMTGMVTDQCTRMAADAASEAGPGADYRIEVKNEPRYQDAAYGVTRPIATGYIIGNEAASRDEAENKSMSKAVRS